MHNREIRPLPKNVHHVVSRGREYFYFQLRRGCANPGPRIRLIDPYSTEEIARGIERSVDAMGGMLLMIQMKASLQAAKGNARDHGRQFSIDLDFIAAMYDQQQGRCAVSGIAFETGGYDGCRLRPFELSIDRIDSSRGYTKDNVRLVCKIANYAMGQWGEAALERLADAIVQKRDGSKLPKPEEQFMSLFVKRIEKVRFLVQRKPIAANDLGFPT